MSRTPRIAFRSHLATWVACVAMLMAALAPSITRAIDAGRTTPTLWATICSASGTRLMAIDVGTSDSGNGQHSNVHAAGCGYCLLATDLAPPPAQANDGRQPTLAGSPPSRPDHPFTPRFAWTVAYSRGPPAVS